MEKDYKIFDLINKEYIRQKRGIELIASENFVSKQVMEAMGSPLTNKYAEGYPGKRYYGGCQIVDQKEQIEGVADFQDQKNRNRNPEEMFQMAEQTKTQTEIKQVGQTTQNTTTEQFFACQECNHPEIRQGQKHCQNCGASFEW